MNRLSNCFEGNVVFSVHRQIHLPQISNNIEIPRYADSISKLSSSLSIRNIRQSRAVYILASVRSRVMYKL